MPAAGAPNSDPYRGPVPRRRPPLLRWGLAGVLVVLAVVAGWGSPADAHAELLSTDPTDGTLLPEAPSQVTLQFTEDVDLQADGVRVLAAEGERVDASAATASGPTVTAPLDGELDDGTYVVAWRVVSADGHPVRGSFTFSVGVQTGVSAEVAEGAFGSGDDTIYEVVGAVLRALAYVTALGAAGAVVIGTELRREGDPTPVGRLVGIAAGLGIVSLLALVPVQAALVSGRGLRSATDRSVLALALGDGYAVALATTALGLLAIVVTTGLPYRGTVRSLAMAGGLVAPLGFALAGHTRTMSPMIVGTVADAVHLYAAAVWFGGLLAVAAAVRRRRAADDPLGAAEAVARFSGVAAFCLAALAVAGGVMGWLEVGGLDPLRSTTYGRLLVAKVVAVAAIAALAGWNRLRLLPRVAAAAVEDPPVDDARSWTALVRLVRLEAVGIVVVLGLTAVLVNVTPAADAYRPGQVTRSAALGDGSVDVTVDPATPGRNDVHIYVFDASGALDDTYTEASVRLELPAEDVGPFDREPVAAGPGHFLLVGTDLPLAGAWDLTLTVKPDRFSEEQATVTVPVR